MNREFRGALCMIMRIIIIEGFKYSHYAQNCSSRNFANYPKLVSSSQCANSLVDIQKNRDAVPRKCVSPQRILHRFMKLQIAMYMCLPIIELTRRSTINDCFYISKQALKRHALHFPRFASGEIVKLKMAARKYTNYTAIGGRFALDSGAKVCVVS